MYKIKFTVDELNKFNLVENDNIRKSLMSIYMYLLKLNDKKNKEYEEASLQNLKDIYKLKISFRKFLAAYNRNHDKVSIATLKSRIDTLVELGLLAIEKAKNSFIYSFHRFTVNKKLNDNPNTFEVPEPVENASKDCNSEEHKYLNSLTKTKELDSNSCAATADNFDYDNYIDNQEKNTSWEYISDLLQKAFKMSKVRSNWIKSKVIDGIFKNRDNITKKHAMSYICTSISNARNQYYSNYNKYVRQAENNRSNYSTFNDFKQRNYDFQSLEKQLLGW